MKHDRRSQKLIVFMNHTLTVGNKGYALNHCYCLHKFHDYETQVLRGQIKQIVPHKILMNQGLPWSQLKHQCVAGHVAGIAIIVSVGLWSRVVVVVVVTENTSTVTTTVVVPEARVTVLSS